MMPRILVVEDEAHIRLLVSVVLQQKGYDVVEAASGSEAFALLRGDNRFDAIVTDLRMPKTDVLNYIDQLREEFPNIPLLIMSAHVTSSWALEAVDKGRALLIKPFTRQQLLDCLDQMLDKGRAGSHVIS